MRRRRPACSHAACSSGSPATRRAGRSSRWRTPGENANGTIDDLEQAAVDLAAFVKALRRIDTTGTSASASAAAADRSPRSTSRFAGRSHSSGTASTALPLSAHGRSRSTPRHGTAPRSGCMATCCRATCSSSTVACRRSSTGAASTWAIPRATCSLRGTCSRVTVASGFRAELEVGLAWRLRRVAARAGDPRDRLRGRARGPAAALPAPPARARGAAARL